MRLTLLDPPVLVGVIDDARTRPALLIGTRGDRCFVQLSRGSGLNHLRWVDARSVAPAVDPLPPQADSPAHPSTGLPWIRTRGAR